MTKKRFLLIHKQRCNCLINSFRTVCSAPTNKKTFSIDVVNPKLLSIKTTASEVKGILQNLDVTKATGADNTPARILKVCSEELSKPLAPCLKDPFLYEGFLFSGISNLLQQFKTCQ